MDSPKIKRLRRKVALAERAALEANKFAKRKLSESLNLQKLIESYVI